jgi:hypothetical protein
MAEMILQEHRSAVNKNHQDIVSGDCPISAQPLPADPSAPCCPTNKCSGRLRPEASGYNPRTGLELMICTLCGHRGFRSRDGVILIFRGGYEYKFCYGPSIQTISIVLSSAAVNLWGTHGVSDDQLAKIAAEWALLCGHTTRPIHLGIPAEDFADCYLYFCKP